VTAVVPQGSALSDAAARDFRSATGFTLRQVEVPADELAQGAPEGTQADVVLGLDAGDALEAVAGGGLASAAPQDTSTPEGTALQGAPAATAYARDDVCVLADTEWFSANRKSLPTSLSDLASGEWADLLLVPDPAGSVEGRAFTRAAQADLGEGVDAWWSALTSGGVRTGSTDDLQELWTASSGAVDGGRPLLVARQSLAAATLNDTGTESTSAAVPGTCLERMLYSAITQDPANPDGAESLVAWLRGSTAQGELASAGVAQPLAEEDAEGTVIGWFSQPTDGAATLPETDVAAAQERAESWSKGLQGSE
jgi:ABC-type thiamine transport system, periplasmic component